MLNLDEIVYKSVIAALDKIDECTNERTKHPSGPCGDKLASELDKVIRSALNKEFNRSE